MTRWYPVDSADDDFFAAAPHIFRYEKRFEASPQRVWGSLTSDQSLAAWGPSVTSVDWLNPRPFGVGTTREVVLPLGSMTVREQFFRWEDGERYSFAVREADRPFYRRFAEDYVVAPDGAGTLFTWTIALEPAPRWARLMRRSDRINHIAFGQVARSATRYFARHP